MLYFDEFMLYFQKFLQNQEILQNAILEIKEWDEHIVGHGTCGVANVSKRPHFLQSINASFIMSEIYLYLG